MSNNTTKKINDEKETKQSFKQVIDNNKFILGLCFKASPSFVICTIANSVRNQVSIFCEHTLLIAYVLEAAEFHYPFKRVASIIIFAFILISIGMYFAAYVGDTVVERERPKVNEKVRMMLYEKAKEVDVACYDKPKFYDDMVYAVSEIDKQIDRCAKFLEDFSAGITMFAITIGYLIIKDISSLIFVIGSFIICYFMKKLYNKISFKISFEKNKYERKRNYIQRIFYLSDYAKDIRLNPEVTDTLFDEFEEANEKVLDIEKKYAKKHFVFHYLGDYIGNNFINDTVYISYLVYKFIVKKVLSISEVAILYTSFNRMREGLRVFTDVYPYLCESSLYIEKIRRFLDYENKIVSSKNELTNSLEDGIKLDKVSFGYEQDLLTLKNIDFKIKKGEKIAIVGYNGAGKTTLVKLLMRLYDTTDGTIYYDDNDIKKFNIQNYRNRIGVVFQDFNIYAGSVKDNIVMDLETMKDDEVCKSVNSVNKKDAKDKYSLSVYEDALKDSGIYDKIKSMTNGLDTQLTTELFEDGVNLSGGEAQKLAISRAFYQNCELLILDEPSSALDPIAEYQLNHAMLKATKDKTVIFISHRLSTTRFVDRIIMLEKGNVIEEGTHDELLSQNGKYAKMWKVQSKNYAS